MWNTGRMCRWAEQWGASELENIIYWMKNLLIMEIFLLWYCSATHITHPHFCLNLTVCKCKQLSLSSIIHLWWLFKLSPASCCALLSPTFSLILFFPPPLLPFSASFHPTSASLSCLKPFILSFLHPTTVSTNTPHLPPSLPLYIAPNLEVPISTRAWQVMGVAPPFLASSPDSSEPGSAI